MSIHPRFIAIPRAERKPRLAERAIVIETTEMERLSTALAGVLGALAVGLGAYGAHGLERFLAGREDAALRADWWETAVLYHLVHAVAIAVTAARVGRAPKAAAILFVVGILLFSGTLYAMTLGAPRVLGAVTPLGGLSLIAAWIAFALGALKKRE